MKKASSFQDWPKKITISDYLLSSSSYFYELPSYFKVNFED
jgi:hypothetical protein